MDIRFQCSWFWTSCMHVCSSASCVHPCLWVCMVVVMLVSMCRCLWSCVLTFVGMHGCMHVTDMHSCGHAWLHVHVCGHTCTRLIALANVSELCHAELGALDFEEGPWFCHFSCPSLESAFNYPLYCAKSEVSAGCHSLLLSRPLGHPLLSQGSAWLCSKSRVTSTSPLKSLGGLFVTSTVSSAFPCLRSGRRRCLLWPCSWLHSFRGHSSSVKLVQLNWFGVQWAPPDSCMGWLCSVFTLISSQPHKRPHTHPHPGLHLSGFMAS